MPDPSVPGEPSDYREQVERELEDATLEWDRLQNSVTRETWEGTKEEFLADKLAEVRDAEMAALVAEGQALATANQTLRNERRELDAEMERLQVELDHVRRDDGNQIQHTVELSKMLRGMARRVAEYRQAANAEAAIVDEEQAEGNQLRAELADLRNRAVILPEDWRQQLEFMSREGDYRNAHYAVLSIESWRTPEPAEPAKATEAHHKQCICGHCPPRIKTIASIEADLRGDGA